MFTVYNHEDVIQIGHGLVVLPGTMTARRLSKPMVPNQTNLVGEVYGMLTVVSFGGATDGGFTWVCECECCSGYSVQYAHTLKQGHCGCQDNKGNRKFKRHGLSNHELYSTWCSMNQRCYNPKHSAYAANGRKGVTVCERWKNGHQGLKNFISDMGQRPLGAYMRRTCPWTGFTVENTKWVVEKAIRGAEPRDKHPKGSCKFCK